MTNHDHGKYVTNEEFKKLTTGNFVGRLVQKTLSTMADIVDFVKKVRFL